MEGIRHQVVIIGAGLTGLTLAYLLKMENVDALIIEARDRVGGRIHTLRPDQGPSLEMGATWLGRKHKAINHLVQELSLPIFEQVLGQRAIYEAISTSPPQLVQLPPNEDPSYRIQNGTDSVIQKLVSIVGKQRITLSEKVKSLTDCKNYIQLTTDQRKLESKIVVSTLAPNLFSHAISVNPSLPEALTGVMNQTHTWMGESIKIALSYAEPFWRAEDLSGTIFSNVGPIPEMYDHSNYNDSAYALKGFLNGAYYSITKQERQELVLSQLRKYYGSLVDNFIEYHESVWRTETLTFAPYHSHILPHENNGHRIFQEPFMNGKLFIGGSETALAFPGYMEGAVQSAQYIFDQLSATTSSSINK